MAAILIFLLCFLRFFFQVFETDNFYIVIIITLGLSIDGSKRYRYGLMKSKNEVKQESYSWFKIFVNEIVKYRKCSCRLSAILGFCF